ncbi:MAG: endonuclease domain-containing protein [Leptolyngbyaceae cyanobacterium]
MSQFLQSLNSQLSQTAPGRVTTFLSAEVLDVINQLALVDTCDRQFVVQMWEQLPQPNRLIPDVLATVAEAAYGIWPAWYDQEEPFLADENGTVAETILLNQFKCKDLNSESQDICLPWLRQAVRACQIGKVPMLSEFSRAVQLSQLLLAIAPHNVSLIVIVADPNPAKHQLLGLAKSMHWLADKTQAPIALLLPEQLANRPELDAVLYDANTLTLAADNSSPDAALEGTGIEEAKHILVPVQGRPHPFSPGEQRLAEKLLQDSELGPLFQFNRPVHTVHHQNYRVDLLWAEGRVVVEIDGYRYHSNRYAFSRDRQRDYELLISGYVVLRLPHDEVINDIELTVEKIRHVVRFRHQTCRISEVSQ